MKSNKTPANTHSNRNTKPQLSLNYKAVFLEQINTNNNIAFTLKLELLSVQAFYNNHN